jgi:toxin ParE1/3/4
MTPRLDVHPRARRDLNELANYLGHRSREAGRRFYDAAQQAFWQLACMPGLGSLQDFQDPRLAGLRCGLVPGYKRYLIFYRPIPDGIEVLRVLHGARDVQGILEAEAGALGDDEGRDEP